MELKMKKILKKFWNIIFYKKRKCNCPCGSTCEFFDKKDETCKYGEI